MMKMLQQLLNEYGESHQNRMNKTIHWFCVPAILFGLTGVLWSIPQTFFNRLTPPTLDGLLTWGTVFVLFMLFNYIRFSITLFAGFIFISLALVYGNMAIANHTTVMNVFGRNMSIHFVISFLLLVIAWVGQFIGHKIEGKKPSFLKDIQFLVIGPAWLMAVIFDKLGIPVTV